LLRRLTVVSVNPRFTTSNNGGDGVGVIFGLFLELGADGNAEFLLVIVQQCGRYPGNHAWTQMSLQCVACSAHATEFADTLHTTNSVNRSPSVFQDSLSHIYHIFGRGSFQMLSRTLAIIDRQTADFETCKPFVGLV
jgi:hypothetical protein